MKKIIAILLAITCVFSFSACAGKPTSVSYTSAWGKADVLETSTYTISVKKSEEAIFEGAPEVEGEGVYSYTISGGDAEGYTLVTALEFAGNFVGEGINEPFVQNITSTVKFGGVTTGFAPTYSEKSYDGSTVVYDSASEKFEISDLDYTSTVKYEKGQAVVSIKDANGDAIASGIPTEEVYKLGKTAVYDNEQIYLIARAFGKTSGASHAFDTVNAVIGETAVGITVGARDEEKDYKTTMTINGKSETIDTYTVNMQINSQFESGTTTIMLYGKDDMGNVKTSSGNTMNVDRSRLLSFYQQVPYTASAFLFELSEYTTNVA